MNIRLINFQRHLIKSLLVIENTSPDINRQVINILFLHQALLNLSYISQLSQIQQQYLKIITVIARPQTVLNLSGSMYFAIIICILYLASIIVTQLRFAITIVVIQLLDLALFNLFMESSQGVVGIVAQALLIFIILIRLVCIQGGLDVNIKNYGTIRSSIYIAISKVLVITQIYLYKYQLDQGYIIGVTIVAALVQIRIWADNQPQQNSNLITIIIGIQLTSIYYCILELIAPENVIAFELLVIPIIFKMVSSCVTIHNYLNTKQVTLDKFIFRLLDVSNRSPIIQMQLSEQFKILEKLFNTSQPTDDIIIFATIYLKLNKPYEAYQILTQLSLKTDSRKQETSTDEIQQAKLNSIIYKTVASLEVKMKSNSTDQNGVTDHVQQLLQSESQNFMIQSQIIQILKLKVQRQNQIQENRLTFWSAYQLISKIISLKERLENQYDAYPSEKTQSVLGFYMVEVLNDFIAANSLFSIAALADDKLMKMGLNSQIFSGKMAYMILDYEDDLIIRKISNNAPSYFKVQNSQLVNQTINFLIPAGIVEFHRDLVQLLFTTGQSKFMRQLNDNYYCQPSDQMLIATEFQVDINFANLNVMNFLAFFQPLQNQPMCMIVNKNRRITLISDTLIQHSGVQAQYIVGERIDLILPAFIEVKSQSCVLEDIEIVFQPQQNVHQSMDTNQYSSMHKCTIHVNVRNLPNQEAAYYIITFDYLKRITGPTHRNSFSSPSPIKVNAIQLYVPENQIINEEVTVLRPYDAEFEFPDNLVHVSLELGRAQNNLFSPIQSNAGDLLISQNQTKYFTRPNNRKVSLEDVEEKREIEIIQEDQVEDQGSQVSSLQGMRRSKYYRKYEIVNKINNLRSYSQNHKLFIAIIIMWLVTQFILTLIQQVNIDTNLTNLVSDIDLLQIKNLAFQPLESFLVTRWTLVNYNQLLDAGKITKAEHTRIGKFSISNLALGYDLLLSNLGSVMNRPELLSFMQDTQLDVQIYTDTNKGQHYTINLRNAINILLNYQYLLKMGFILDGRPPPDSPQIYYSYRNYKPLKDQFTQLNENVYIDTIDRANDMKYTIVVLFILISVTLTILFYFIIQYYFRIQAIYLDHFKAIMKCDVLHIEIESMRYRFLLDQISKDSNIFFKYQWHFEVLENQLQNQIEKVKEDKQKRKDTYQNIPRPRPKSTIYLILLYIIVIVNAISTYIQSTAYLDLYPQTAQLYKEMSDVGTDVPTLYAQREVLYGRFYFPYFDAYDLDQVLQEILKALHRTTVFSSSTNQGNSILLSDAFYEFYQKVENSDLCAFLDPEMAIKAADFCQVVMNGNMQRGLKSILIYIVNQIQTDMEINTFTSRNYSNYLELEGAFLVSEIMRKINKEFNIDLSQQTNKLLSQINLYNVMLLAMIVIVIFVIFIIIKQQLIKEYYIIQRMIYLAPRLTILIDDHFERNIRSMIIEDLIN